MTGDARTGLLVSAAEFLEWATDEQADDVLDALGLSSAASSEHLRAWGDAFAEFKRRRLDEEGRHRFIELETTVRTALREPHELVVLIADGRHWFACRSATAGFVCRVEELGWLSLSSDHPSRSMVDVVLDSDQMLVILADGDRRRGWAWRGIEAYVEDPTGWTPTTVDVVRQQVSTQLVSGERSR